MHHIIGDIWSLIVFDWYVHKKQPVIMKLASLLALLSVTSASAFVAPRSSTFTTLTTAPRAISLSASPNDSQHQQRITNEIENLSHAATVAAATIAATLASSPLAALAEEADDYVYGEVNAPGGIGECVRGVGCARIDEFCDIAR